MEFTPNGTQDLLLILCLVITPVRNQGTICSARDQIGLGWMQSKCLSPHEFFIYCKYESLGAICITNTPSNPVTCFFTFLVLSFGSYFYVV